MAETATAAAKPNLEKRDAILAAALRLIARFGLHNTPMSAVAREAGVAVGNGLSLLPEQGGDDQRPLPPRARGS